MSAAAPALEQFANPPIVEAILSIRVELPDGAQQSAMDDFQRRIGERYPTRISGAWLAGSDSSGASHECLSLDGAELVRVQGGTLTFHRLQPYLGWDAFRMAGEWVWNAFREAFQPRRIELLGLRYVDRIELPLPHDRLEDYLRLMPPLDWPLADYLIRMVVPDMRSGATGRLTLASEPISANAITMVFVLDTDVSRVGSFEVSERFMWGTLEQLRAFKNRLFFEATTDRARELFR